MALSVAPRDLADLNRAVQEIAIEAGDITLRYFRDPRTKIMGKSDGSPFSLADTESEDYVTQALLDLTPAIPVIGEEATERDKKAGIERDFSGFEYVWQVDPLDGTREFVDGLEEYTVNIALLRRGFPLLGVVGVPAKKILFAGHGPGTASKRDLELKTETPIRVRKVPREGLTVVSSAREGDQEKLEKLLGKFNVHASLKYGSALKICAIAAGEADFYPRFGPTREWDTSAADGVLRSAGGLITDAEGRRRTYLGENPGFLNPDFVVSSFNWMQSSASHYEPWSPQDLGFE